MKKIINILKILMFAIRVFCDELNSQIEDSKRYDYFSSKHSYFK